MKTREKPRGSAALIALGALCTGSVLAVVRPSAPVASGTSPPNLAPPVLDNLEGSREAVQPGDPLTAPLAPSPGGPESLQDGVETGT